MEYIAVVDTETNWRNQVMSIGVVIGDSRTFQPREGKYYVLTPEYQVGGMFDGALFQNPGTPPRLCTRQEALGELICWLRRFGVRDLFAYNAPFDKRHLPEMGDFCWFDIMGLAAYRQHNPRIPASAECCATGRLKRGYGVEAMLRLLSGSCTYRETHNALDDARDELRIMALLGCPPERYPQV